MVKHALIDDGDLVAEASMEKAVIDKDGIYCFGMIHGIPFKLAECYEVVQTPIELTMSPTTGELLDKNISKYFGLLRQRERNIMDILHRETTVHLFADFLSTGPKKGVKSKHPRHCKWNVPYLNPQCLAPEDGGIIYTSELENTFNESEPKAEVSINPIDLFADATVPDALEDAITPCTLSTELYKHQKQALTFMTQRERGWALDGHHMDVWREEKTSLSQTSYHNVVSGLKQTIPPKQFRGGLLIDAPGLGKSLSIIALIASGIQSRDNRTPITGVSLTTLLIVPKTLIEMWKDEIQKHLLSADTIQYCVYYGKDRIRYLDELNRYTLMITTYSVVLLDWKTWLAKPTNPSTLYAKRWERIVLDEAHVIREPSKSFAKSVCALEAQSRWAVSGTPIQNRLLDLFSLFKFLRCAPFDDFRVFNAQVVQNWKARSDPDCVARLKTLVNCLSLRRPKATIKLLPREDEVIYLDFNEQEAANYKAVKGRALNNLEEVKPDGRETSGPAFVNALKWINELRLICNHGIKSSLEAKTMNGTPQVWSPPEAQARFDQLEGVGLAKCSNTSCCQDVSSVMFSDAGTDHDDDPWISVSLEIWCSLCSENKQRRGAQAYQICNHVPRRIKQPVKSVAKSSNLLEVDLTAPLSYASCSNANDLPTKVNTLVQSLTETPENIKSVVFSSWTKTFDIIQPQLWAKSIRCVRLDGNLSALGRAKVLRVFRSNPGIRVLLATISCGGVGLDLTAASRAYIMEPQWNPMSESQALDRIYRLGQQNEVKTVRYIMRGSWEEQVLKLQRRKQELADLTLNHQEISRADLTYGRLQYLRELVS